MKKHTRKTNYKEKGITLIALVVTIIVLLILAGVTLNLVLGQNGIINRSQYASNTWANATKDEDTMMGQMSSIIDAHKKSTSDVNSGNITGTPVTELQEGDEVIYTAPDGTEIPCIVLYDSTGNNGIQIITKEVVGESFEIGKHYDIESSRKAYNTLVARLNLEAKKYLNTNLATDARCVGSNPSEKPVTREENTGTYTNNYQYFSSYNNQFKTAIYYSSDFEQLTSLGCLETSKYYWWSGRGIDESNTQTTFYLKYVRDRIYSAYTVSISSDLEQAAAQSYCLRPVFILAPETVFVSEAGTKKLYNSGSGSETLNSITELQEGNEIVYTAGDGREIPCIVLYDSTSEYGIQVISADIIDNIELGNGSGSTSSSRNETDFQTAKESYNTAVAILNTAAKSYINTDLSPADGARCVGSDPGVPPVIIEYDTGTFSSNRYKYSFRLNNMFKTGDQSFFRDLEQMNKSSINCARASASYWMASRYYYESDVGTDFYVLFMGGEYGWEEADVKPLCTAQANGYNYNKISFDYSLGLRPIFSLWGDLHFIEENGTKKIVQ